MTNAIVKLRENIARVFLGRTELIDRVVCCLLARGHLLIEDVPGVGKTVLATAIARSVDCSFSRIQLTPDMLPADVLGVSVLDRESSEFVFKRGPIFANVVLADEINRTTPRTQSALLEAMSESSVSMDGRRHALPEPFMLVATQNPFEFEGTYPLPENQLDRFLMRTPLGYPSPEDEARVLELRPATHVLDDLRPVIGRDELIALQRRVDDARVDRSLLDYIVSFAAATRTHDALQVGLSPRGSLSLAQAARATAVCDGRDYVIPEDITANIPSVVPHRVVTRTHFGRSSPDEIERLLDEIVETVASPA